MSSQSEIQEKVADRETKQNWMSTSVRDLIDLGLRIKSAGEGGIIKPDSFSFQRFEDRDVIEISYETFDGFKVQCEIAEFPADKRSSILDEIKHPGLPKPNLVRL
jgi:hypothetical protein